jgi:BON domain
MAIMTNRTFRNIWPAALLAAGLLASSGTPALAQSSQDRQTTGQVAQESTATNQRSDGQIEMDVVHALDAAPALQQDWITAGTVQGEVTLSGTSATEANRKLAESIASRVNGVTRVVNNLKVGDPQSAQAGAEAGLGQDQQQGQYQGQYSDQQQGQDQSQGQYPEQGQPQPPPPGYTQYPQAAPQQGPPPGYRPVPQPPQTAQVPEPPHVPVTIARGALLKLRTTEPLDSKKAQIGTPVEFTVMSDVYAVGVVAIPRGATIRGEVTNVAHAGALGGKPELALRLNTLELEGTSYPLDATPFEVKGPNKAGLTAGNTVGGALLGALIGGAVGGGGGAAIGAVAGGAGGTAASAATPGPRVWIPAEAILDFHLNTDLTVTPVSRREAARLAQYAPLPYQRPTLYRRAYYPYPYGYYPYGYPPPPPPPGYYYRPY